MPTTQINLRLDDEIIARVDAVRGDVPRNRWIARAVDDALGAHEDPYGPLAAKWAALTDVEKREMSRQDLARFDSRIIAVPGPNVENIRSSAQVKAGVQPRPKGK